MNRSFAHCRSITRAAKSSFPLAFRLLPAPQRRAMDALYAFLRVTDDLADEPGDVALKRVALARWRGELHAAIAGDSTHPVHPALVGTLQRFAIPPQLLTDVIDGVEADLEPIAFSTFAELYPYCYRVASAVGLACVHIWGVRPGVPIAAATESAEAAGIAFQLTNILRDLGEDLARGRVYLPADELLRFGSPPESWRSPREAAAFQALMRFQTRRANDYYDRGAELIPLLTADGRAVFRMMSETYRGLLRAIERKQFDVFSARVRVPKWRKLAVLASAWSAKWVK